MRHEIQQNVAAHWLNYNVTPSRAFALGHWGAYGDPPMDSDLLSYVPDAPPGMSFRSPVHAVRLSNDGLGLRCRSGEQPNPGFSKDGSFVKEAFVARQTLAMGSIWDIELSRDTAQTYMYIPDGTNQKVWILGRDELKVVGSFGRGGRYAGQFGCVHNAAMDSRGNLYTTEVETGKRIQKFRSEQGT